MLSSYGTISRKSNWKVPALCQEPILLSCAPGLPTYTAGFTAARIERSRRGGYISRNRDGRQRPLGAGTVVS